MKTYVNVLTGEVVELDYVPAGDAWQPRKNAAMAKRLLRDERATKTTPDEGDDDA